MLARLSRVARSISFIQPVRAFAGAQTKNRVKITLEKELQYEKENYVIDDSIPAFLDQQGFVLQENSSSGLVKLRATKGNYDVEVQFCARPPNATGEEEEHNQEAVGGEDGMQEDPEFVDFLVWINKSSSRGGIVYECSSVEGEIHVNNIIYSDNFNQLEEAIITMNRDLYRGPDFMTLDDELQDSLHDFLSELGIDEDMATFVETYSLDKDQRLYMEWLKNMKDMVN